MSKKLKILLISLTTFIIIVIIGIFVLNLVEYKRYASRKIIKTNINCNNLNESFEKENKIQLDEILVKLTKIGYYPEGNDDINAQNVVDFTLEFQSDDLDINNIQFDYIIFDNQNRILNTSLWDNLNKTKPYIRGFVKEKYNKNSFTKINDYTIFVKKASYNNITDNLKTVSQTITSSLKEEIGEPEQITIRIINLNYQFKASDNTILDNTDLEFVLNFNR